MSPNTSQPLPLYSPAPISSIATTSMSQRPMSMASPSSEMAGSVLGVHAGPGAVSGGVNRTYCF